MKDIYVSGEEKKDKEVVLKKRKKGKMRLDTNPFHSFRYHPKDAEFVHKDKDEEIVLLLRQHPVTNLGWIALTFFLLLLPGFLTAMSFYEALSLEHKIISILIWYLFVFTYAFEKFLGWFFSVNIITDVRLFDVDFHNYVYRKITDANIDQIQDVTVEGIGGLRAAFNYGDIRIQTAAGVPEIEFEAVPYPDKAAKILRELRTREDVYGFVRGKNI